MYSDDLVNVCPDNVCWTVLELATDDGSFCLLVYRIFLHTNLVQRLLTVYKANMPE